ncbi:MAG TPA: DUF4369 domain-containing protein [Flavobacteriaceae bacterium]|nr:DUF4369 domain-containing protein [Flavobacteriaceae bacterium]
MRRIGLVFVVFLGLISCKKEIHSTQNTVLFGKIEGIKTGKLYLERLTDSVAVIVDSVTFNGNSDFSFAFDIDSPEMVYLYLEKTINAPINDFLAVFVEPGKIDVQTTLENFEADAKVSGSVNHEKWVEYQQLSKRYQDKRLELIKEIYEAEMKNNTQKILDINRQNQLLIQSSYMSTVNFALNNSDLEIAPFLAMYEIFDINTKYLDTINSQLTERVKNSKYGKDLQKYIFERKNLE